MNWLKTYKKLILEGGIVLVLLCTVAVMGQLRMVSASKISASVAAEENASIEAAKAAETDVADTEESGTEETVTEESQGPVVPQLSEKQTVLLQELLSYLDANQLEEAARLLIEKESQFTSLFYTSLESKDYLYRDGELHSELEGQGLVFQKPGTIFYGNFAAGVPEGENLALQAVNLDAPRYDYADGSWSNGYMNGYGTIGYQYYQGIEGDEPWDVKKEGSFIGDLMDGDIVYSSTDANGQGLTWYLSASAGVTVIDDRWQYNAGQYLLISETDDDSAYILKEEDKDSLRWMNLILWSREE